MRVPTASVVTLLLLLTASATVSAQSPSHREEPSLTVLAGVGTTMGWFGGQVSGVLPGTGVALFAGLGYTPGYSDGRPSGATFAVGARRYFSSRPHQGYVGLALAQLVTVWEESPFGERSDRLYGPALMGGYQYTAGSGFTVLAGLGVGYAPDFDDWDPPLVPALDLALGYTWR